MTKYEKNDYFILLFFISKKGQVDHLSLKILLKIFIPPWGADLFPGKRQNFICLNMGFLKKIFSPPGDMLKILIPPGVKNDFLKNAKILPLLTSGFSRGPSTGPVGNGYAWRLSGMSRQYARTHKLTVKGFKFCKPTHYNLKRKMPI